MSIIQARGGALRGEQSTSCGSERNDSTQTNFDQIGNSMMRRTGHFRKQVWMTLTSSRERYWRLGVFRAAAVLTAIFSMSVFLAHPASAQTEDPAVIKDTTANASTNTTLPPLGKDWVRLGQDKNQVWIHRGKKQVAVSGEVCLTKGYLEMFACIVGTKEHESVVALHSKAFVIHTGLLAVGAKPGSPAQWRPKYRPATGTKVKLELEWVDQDGRVQRADAKQWIRDLKTQKAMTHDWVFAGSLFWVDPETKKQFYRAEGGEIVCVSNFPVAMLDLPIESSQANDELAFEALTENIPPRRTAVRLYFKPEIPETKKKAENSNSPIE